MADTLNILSLYSGSGMHDEAVCAALDVLGYRGRVVGYCERDSFAAALLLARMETASLERAPVWCGCISKLDARPLQGHVDIVVASPPCQPYSSAGKRAGLTDARSYGDGDGPLPHTIRVIGECRPSVVWLENVGEWVTGGAFQRFGEELSDLGYEIEEPLFLAAEDVGAPHERERVFVMGHAAGWQRRIEEQGRGQNRGTTAGWSGEGAGDTERQRARAGTEQGAPTQQRRHRPAKPNGDVAQPEHRGVGVGTRCAGRCAGERPSIGIGLAGDSEELADAQSPRREGHEPAGNPRADGRAGELNNDLRPMFPPGRDDYRQWAELVTRGLDASLMPAIESGVSVVFDGVASSADLLRVGGNGVVPLAAAVAFCVLWNRANRR